jgi:hypothetical protein
MKQIFLFFLFFCAFQTNIFAQEENIEIVKTIFGLQFYKDNKLISKHSLKTYLKQNPKSIQLYDKGVMNNTFANISGAIGGFMLGYQVGLLLNNKPVNVAPLLAGIGFVVVSIPLASSGTKNIKSAIEQYNSNINKKVSYNLIFNQRGVGLLVKF